MIALRKKPSASAESVRGTEEVVRSARSKAPIWRQREKLNESSLDCRVSRMYTIGRRGADTLDPRAGPTTETGRSNKILKSTVTKQRKQHHSATQKKRKSGTVAEMGLVNFNLPFAGSRIKSCVLGHA